MASGLFNFNISKRPLGRVVRQLLIICIAAFVAELLISPARMLNSAAIGPLAEWFGLSWHDLGKGMIWQVVTHIFFHGSPMHLLMNMLGLYFLGSALESRIGSQQFLKLYLACGIAGGVGWLLLSRGVGFATCVGASGSIMGLLGAFAALYPQERFILFPIPIPISVRNLAIGIGVITLVFLRADAGGVAHAAHLAGGIAGYFYGQHIGGSANYRRSRASGSRFSNLRAWFRRRQYHVVEDPSAPVNWADVDRILDKIRIQGIDSLTRTEKTQLDRASKTPRR
jgi:membrane associated rhomboid family serine protease